METEYETRQYAFRYSGLFGVGRFIRKSDGHMTLLETGTDCQDLRQKLQRLWQSFGRKKGKTGFATWFNQIAREYTFYNPDCC